MSVLMATWNLRIRLCDGLLRHDVLTKMFNKLISLFKYIEEIGTVTDSRDTMVSLARLSFRHHTRSVANYDEAQDRAEKRIES
jgi:hypothetical protein